MRIGIIHGYLLNGTGSNLYVQNICRQFCKMGHEVILFCQDKSLKNYDFIEKGYNLDEQNIKLNQIYNSKTPYNGKCICINPNINKILPVYVHDNYEGFEAIELTKMTQKDIEKYILANEKAIKTSIEVKPLDMIISNHIIMQPICVSRAVKEIENIIKITIIHGSSLNFSVKKSKILEEYAIEGLNKSDHLIYLTNHSKKEFHEFFDDKIKAKAKEHIIPAGVDIDKFVPLLTGESKFERIETLIKSISPKINSNQISKDEKKIDINIKEKLMSIDWEKDKIIIYYGKYLWTKGIHNVILAMPLILKEHPNTKFVLIGFGNSKKYLHNLVKVLNDGNLNELKKLVEKPQDYQDSVESESINYSKWILELLKDSNKREEYLKLAKNQIKDKIIFAGFMDHDELSKLIPCADIAIAPSIFPEAFGLVGVEALACGIIPLQTYHSGFKCVVDTYIKLFDLDINLQNIDKLQLNEKLILKIGQSINKILQTYEIRDETFRDQIKIAARSICIENYSWEFVANRFLLIK